MNPVLQAESASPLYRQLMQRLRGDITAGIYPTHSRIPSEAALMAHYGVSRVTVRRALAELTREGMLIPQQGKGTFVAAVPHLTRDLRGVSSFHDACRVMGCRPGARVLRAGAVPAMADDLEKLAIHDAEVIEIVRLRLADDLPVMLETNRFSLDFDWLLREDLSGSLYALLSAHGWEIGRGIHEISLTYASDIEAEWLDIAPGAALMRLDQVIFDCNDRPLHTSHQVIRGDRFTFRI